MPRGDPGQPGPDRLRGVVKFFNAGKNFGFIHEIVGRDHDAYFSGNAVEGLPLDKGDEVEFTLSSGKLGPVAGLVSRVGVDTPAQRTDDFLPAPIEVRECVVGSGPGSLGGVQAPRLALNRFLLIDPDSTDKNVNKSTPFTTFANGFQSPNPAFQAALEHLAGWHARRGALVKTLTGGGMDHVRLNATVVWRTIVGMGSAGPWDTGLTLDHLLGVPYFPTSALHGLARRGARLSGPDGAREDAYLGSPKGKGNVLFLPGLPDSETLRLDVDVMTPHRNQYYGGSGSPRDSELRPIPVPFLTVGAGSQFRIDLLAPSGSKALGAVEGWLTKALEELGFGAKTRGGYGELAVESAVRQTVEGNTT